MITSRSKKQPDPDEPPGAPEWMVTFSDCMTLLLTFFVLLLSFSSFDEHVFENLEVIFADALPSASSVTAANKDALLSIPQIESRRRIDEGSEKPTLEGAEKEGLKNETDKVDFLSQKVFLVPSEKIFWAKGTAISQQGHQALAAMASFLREIPSRIVISENGPAAAHSKNFGLPRAWAVVEYLVRRQGLDRNRFSISAASTLPPDSVKNDQLGVGPARTLEIVLLERSICH